MSLPLEQIASATQASVERLLDVRERTLNAAANRVLGARSTPLADPCWPSMGRGAVDVVVGDPPTLVAELKWNQAAQDKIYEGIWDLFKVGNLAAKRGCEAWLITGATERIWATSWCADLLAEGTLSARELCQRRFPRGGQWLAWADLLDGGRRSDGTTRPPLCVPRSFKLTDAQEVRVADRSGSWLLRAVRVQPSEEVLRFVGDWPEGFEEPPLPRRLIREVPATGTRERHPELDRLDRRAGGFLDRVRDELATTLAVEASPHGAPRAFLARRLSFTDTGGRPTRIRLGIAPADSDMNVPGLGDAFFAGIEHEDNGKVDASVEADVSAAGFPAQRTLRWPPGHWRHLDLDAVLADQDAVIAQLAHDLRATGLLPPRQRPH